MTKDEAITLAAQTVEAGQQRIAAAILKMQDLEERAPREAYEAIAAATGTFHLAWDNLTDAQRRDITRAMNRHTFGIAEHAGTLKVIDVMGRQLEKIGA